MSSWPAELQEIGEKATTLERIAMELRLLKAESLALDARRQANKSALTQLRRHGADVSGDFSGQVWVCGGQFFIHQTPEATIDALVAEEKTLTSRIEELRESQRALLREASALTRLGLPGASGEEGYDEAAIALLLKG